MIRQRSKLKKLQIELDTLRNQAIDDDIEIIDELDDLDSIKICVAYEFEGKRHDWLPHNQSLQNQAVPIYEEFKGWKCDLSEIKNRSELPKEAENYLNFIENSLNIPVDLVGVGPGRHQYFRRQK